MPKSRRMVLLAVGLVAALLCSAVRAQDATPPSPREASLGLGVGWAEPNDYDGGLYLSGAFRLHLTGWLVVEPEVGYFKSSRVFPGFSTDSRSDLSGSVALLAQSSDERVRVSAGPGIGVHSVETTLEFFPDEQVEGWRAELDDTKFGIHAQVGVDVALGRAFWLFGLLRYDLLKGQAQNEGKVVGGLRYRFRRSR